ncbi:WAP four-disulfide core domain protein 5 isoform X1 [Erinaceus europaeus]|uniref:WAP four-disulfide core domain protein 5 n=2 Tax=Erinaceus europaeus TaxID=9365 RepID=A0A1S3A870_ERIEU|nr:WAP four-disulfide core domain protein 5 isoform X1 [Erinaceus europaeus]
MRMQSLLLLGALLVLGIQLPAASGRRKKEKSGSCPPDDGPCLSVPDQCLNDSQCPTNRKCCSKACFRQCIPKISVRVGSCPKDRLQCHSPVQHLCNKDSDCKGSKKCCLTACGRDCRNPARGMAPTG